MSLQHLQTVDKLVAFAKQAAAYCQTVNDCGVMSSVAMGQYARLRNLHEGKPIDGKWKQWGRDQDAKRNAERSILVDHMIGGENV